MAREPETFEVTIAAGDAVAVVEFTEIRGQVWEDVTAHCPPRDGYPSDATHGFNPVATPAHYPVSAIRIDGESVDGATWAELVSLLDAPALEDMGTALWAVHYWQPRQKLARLLAERKEKA